MVIDRPRGSRHPRYPAVGYPLDDGRLVAMCSGDGDENNVYRRRESDAGVTAAAVTIDLLKRDAEFGLLVNCTPVGIGQALTVHECRAQEAPLILRHGSVKVHVHGGEEGYWDDRSKVMRYMYAVIVDVDIALVLRDAPLLRRSERAYGSVVGGFSSSEC